MKAAGRKLRYASVVLLPVAIARVFEDRQKETEYLNQRDSLIARELPRSRREYSLLMYWLHALDADKVAFMQRFESRVLSICALLGLVLGMLCTASVIWLDTPQPVNILLAWGLLVGLPLLLMCCSLLFVVPARLFVKIPVLSGLSRFFEELVPTSYILMFVNWLQRRQDAALSQAAGTELLTSPLFARYRRWSALVFAQQICFFFSVACSLSLLLAVAVTDVAFVWSTSLDLDAGNLKSVFSTLSAPWQTFAPEAVPGIELIESTRYYRMQRDYAEAEQFGGWWPFLLLSIFFYGIVPRLFFLQTCAFFRRRAARKSLFAYPGVKSRLHWLKRPMLSSQAGAGEAQEEDPVLTEKVQEKIAFTPSLDCILILWASAADEALSRHIMSHASVENAASYHLGGKQSRQEDAAQIESIKNLLREAGEGRQLAFFVKSWEPPTAECLEAIDLLVSELGPAAKLCIVLVPMLEGTEFTTVRERDFGIWHSCLAGRVTLEVLE